MNVVTKEKHGSPTLILPGPAISVGFNEPASRRHQQCPGKVCRGISQHSRRICNHDFALGCSFNIDVVKAHCIVGENLHRRKRIHDFGVYGISQQAEDGILAFATGNDFLLGENAILGIHGHLKILQ
jgi:hypothetical protein